MKLTLLLQPASSLSPSEDDLKTNHLALTVTVADDATVEDLKMATLDALPPNVGGGLTSHNINLWFSRQRLHHAEKLDFYAINDKAVEQNPSLIIYITIDNDSLNVASDAKKSNKIKKSKSSSLKSKSKSKKCSFSNCTSLPLRMVGDCQLCQGKFCSKHRLLESHLCKGLKNWKDTCFERNAIKLQNEQTVASKV